MTESNYLAFCESKFTRAEFYWMRLNTNDVYIAILDLDLPKLLMIAYTQWYFKSLNFNDDIISSWYARVLEKKIYFYGSRKHCTFNLRGVVGLKRSRICSAIGIVSIRVVRVPYNAVFISLLRNSHNTSK